MRSILTQHYRSYREADLQPVKGYLSNKKMDPDDKVIVYQPLKLVFKEGCRKEFLQSGRWAGNV